MFNKINVILVLVGVLLANPDYRENRVLFCLNSDIQPLQIERNNDKIEVNHESLNRFLKEIDVKNITKWIPFATEEDHANEIYLNRVYRLHLGENSQADRESIKQNLTTIQGVHSAELEVIHRPTYTPNDQYYNYQWFLTQIDVNDAWDEWSMNGNDIPGDRNVILASVDTGVDWDHPDLRNNLWQNLGEDADGDGHTIEYSNGQWILDPGDLNGVDDDDWDDNGSTFVDDLIGWDHSGWSGLDDNDPRPKSGVSNYSTWAHGTHVAGLLSATTDNSTGIASAAFNCSIMSIKCSEESQTGEPYIDEGYSGILYAAKAGYYDGGFAIVNNSWGGYGYSAYEQATIDVAHDTYNAILIAAAGNGSSTGWNEEEAAHYPSSYENIISVCPTGTNDSWGHWATYHSTVDLASPGENIRSTIINSYTSWDGSSMASPIVASVFGLLRSQNMDWSNDQLETMVLATADPRLYDVIQESYLQGNLGVGRVDAGMAVITPLFPKLEFAGEDMFIINDSNGEINPGEEIELRVILFNEPSWGTATDVVGTLSSSSPYVTITSGEIDFGDIASGDAGLNEIFPFTAYFGSNTPEGDIEFSLNISSNEYDYVIYETSIPLTYSVFDSPIMFGDLNQDGVLNILDVVSEVNIIIGLVNPSPYQIEAGDMNADGTINIQDIILLVNAIMG